MTLRVRAEENLRDDRDREFAIIRVEDAGVGLIAFLAIEADARGRPGFGGLRRSAYLDETAARREALALASGMARKLRCAEMPAIGAKAVMIDHPGLDRERAYASFGSFVAGFEGRYVCGPDLGTTEDDLNRMRERTRHVNHPDNAPGLTTARGVAVALSAAAGLHSGADPVLVEGLGSVGGALARLLVAEGRSVVGRDTLGAIAPSLRAELGDSFDFGEEAEASAGTYAPCARGRTLDLAALERWRGGVICGSANDQLAADVDAETLRRHEVLWVPDFVANPGAVVEGVLVAAGRRAEVPAALEAIGSRTASILLEAKERGVTPWEVAIERAEARP